MQFNFLGGAMEVGGSCILLEIDGKRILMDAGIRQGGAKDPIPDFRKIQQQGGLDAVVLSHAHMDHTGCIPIISREYPLARIYTTHMTADLTRVLLADSLKIMDRREAEIPYYAQNHVFAALDRMVPLHYEVPFPIFEGITVTFYQAGHIAGAACVYLQAKEGSVLYSGDFSSFSQMTIEGARVPKLRPDVAIVESTYGDRLHSNRQVEEQNLIRICQECIDKKGKMLIPAFALGRAQEVLLILKRAMNTGKLGAVPVYVDGMVRDINTAYTRNPLYLKNALAKRILKGGEPFYDEMIQAVKPMEDRDKLMRQEGPGIFVSSSGMLTGGPSLLYAQMIAPMEDGYIVITGYQDEEAPGRKLLECLEDENEGERTITLDQKTIPLRCQVKQVGLSAHGDKTEIRGLLEHLEARNIFLVHGDGQVITGLAKELSGELRARIFAPECGQEEIIEIHNPRKQLKKQFGYTMQKKDPPDEKGIPLLWDYVRTHYPGRLFTAEELCFVWYGCRVEEERVKEIRTSLCLSAYFEPDQRRLFLMRAGVPEAVKTALTPKGYTVQELEEAVKEIFAGFPYRKISFRQESKEVILNVDFPQALPEDRKQLQEVFLDRYGWSVGFNDNMNNLAAGQLLEQLFPGRVQKVSFFATEWRVRVKLWETMEGDEERSGDFQRAAGWKLEIDGLVCEKAESGLIGRITAEGPSEYPGAEKGASFMEQNRALDYIDRVFQEFAHRPTKKSIRSDNKGKYIEISFVTPGIARRYGEVLAGLALDTGWRLKTGCNANVLEIVNQAGRICSKYQIALAKNPSYQPGDGRIAIKTRGEMANWKAAEEEIREALGCQVLWNGELHR